MPDRLHTYIVPVSLHPVRTVLRRRAPRSPPTSSPPAPPVDTYALPSTVSFAARTDGRHAGASHCATRRPPRGPETVGIWERAGGGWRTATPARDLLRASWRLDPRRPRRGLKRRRARYDRARAAAAAPVCSDPDTSHGSRARQRRALAARRPSAGRERRRARVRRCSRAVVMYCVSGRRNRAILGVCAHLFASCATSPRPGAAEAAVRARRACVWCVSGYPGRGGAWFVSSAEAPCCPPARTSCSASATARTASESCAQCSRGVSVSGVGAPRGRDRLYRELVSPGLGGAHRADFQTSLSGPANTSHKAYIVSVCVLCSLRGAARRVSDGRGCSPPVRMKSL